MIMDFLKKDVKIDRKVIILFVIFNFLIMGIYYTYSIFVIKQLKENVSNIAVKTNIIEMTSTDLIDNSVTVSAGNTKDITISLSNSSSVNMYYRIMHKGVPTGVSVYEKNSDRSSFGLIETSGNKTTVITVNNTTSQDVTIDFLLQESNSEKFDKDIGTSYVNVRESFDHSGARKPSILNNMIPVYYEPAASATAEGTWKKADVNNDNSDYIWYDYDNFMWANAVTVTSTNRENYIEAEPGTVIAKNDINAFFVWIPKYKYYVVSADGNASYEKIINVNFVGRDDISSEGTVTCVESISTLEDPHAYSEICTDDTYGSVQNNLSTYLHPSFDDVDAGFWVGKFANRNYSTINIVNNISVNNPGTIATNSYVRQMVKANNVYGFQQNTNATYNAVTWLYTKDIKNIDTHPITSMEWGAVAILTNSSYGKSSNPMYYTDTEKSFTRVYNNSSYQYTGRATYYTTSSTSVNTTSTSTNKYYFDLTNVTYTKNNLTYPIGMLGPGASTTGTIYGIYDMAGGNYTTVMGIVMKEDGTMPSNVYKMDSKYYTAYSYIPYSGKITGNDKAGYLEVFRLGDGIKEHVRTFTEKGMWQDGELILNNYGIMRRGGYTTSGSLFSTEIINDTTTYETFTVLKYTPD